MGLSYSPRRLRARFTECRKLEERPFLSPSSMTRATRLPIGGRISFRTGSTLMKESINSSPHENYARSARILSWLLCDLGA